MYLVIISRSNQHTCLKSCGGFLCIHAWKVMGVFSVYMPGSPRVTEFTGDRLD